MMATVSFVHSAGIGSVSGSVNCCGGQKHTVLKFNCHTVQSKYTQMRQQFALLCYYFHNGHESILYNTNKLCLWHGSFMHNLYFVPCSCF